MPARNIIKSYVENGYYHVYNRGVEKRNIFIDEQDCEVFLHYLKLYLSPVEKLTKANFPFTKRLISFIRLNLSKELSLIAFTLMPNHIHLLLKQVETNSMEKLMRRLITSYVMYFNRKYKRVGALFQNRYKAALIGTDNYLLHISRYIHINPLKVELKVDTPDFRNFSSYSYYLEKNTASWVKPQEILKYFYSDKHNKNIGYQNFVDEYLRDEEKNLIFLNNLILAKYR